MSWLCKKDKLGHSNKKTKHLLYKKKTVCKVAAAEVLIWFHSRRLSTDLHFKASLCCVHTQIINTFLIEFRSCQKLLLLIAFPEMSEY